ncbi:hypothetical protein TCAL_00469 [Tigriopus californicus]|uniref:Major facilitator superfamily (MFS) profile domain-containing protein n=2 Tax=Tigriopus californicus TaxID=6832 RepID=A0A553NCB9_TIGCA|nr:sodium-dependent glucose transporter 1-like isoform X2 [Tigriopus californicus]XP_059093352.1 sodium-dependent glucose transporter 1-like isoform X2 [Tigriopus californicus]XP_059093353.1 sodium-dependent glucose transporter 1-like isoform X2 [Tigriopus californicus]XP_059093354.1 sodium-dependent glucose transporter 1-like isoform X2 [Tigriopus californicus]TRY63094.1 hypothetical protein TCAL_00469 [Tigriopus californicus]|eukprot:TCALIF_00469-PA protein Name:"Similar to naglt1 Sodium-dependent glucose transporter 1 (Danio rerio)" AED:0.00 eAED:0.00 QI:20/1/1/1/1/1/5/209/480
MGISREARWYALFLPSSWLSNVGHGLMVTVVGPTQPYLAKNVGVNIAVINLVWTFGFLGYIIGSLGTGFIFKRYLTNPKMKLAFLWITLSLNGVGMLILPFITNFGLLVTVRGLQYGLLGAYITADSSMLVYTMGPIKSRPFTNALHACVGIGFLAATFLVRPFLPSEASALKNKDQVCFGNGTNVEDPLLTVDLQDEDAYLWGIQKIAWPFIISGIWCCVFSLGYLILGFLPLTMPIYYQPTNKQIEKDGHGSEMEQFGDEEDSKPVGSKEIGPHHRSSQPRIRYWKQVLTLVFFYYAFSCGIERIYQPMAYTFGLCGPLKLAPRDAVITDSTYNGGFMTGRIVSVLLGGFVKPRNMIFASSGCCISASILLIAVGTSNKFGLYIGTAILGFFVSWQFGSCYSWISQKGDITGRISPIFFLGCGFGSSIFPPLSGFVFNSALGPMGILYLTLMATLCQFVIYATMWALSRAKPTQMVIK